MAVAEPETELAVETASQAGTEPLVVVGRILIDAGSSAAAAVVAYLVRFYRTPTLPEVIVHRHLQASIVWTVLLVAMMARSRLYDEDTLFEGGGEFTRVWRSVAMSAALGTGLAFVIHDNMLSRIWVAMLILSSGSAVSISRKFVRTFMRSARTKGRFLRSVVVIGRSDDLAEWAQSTASDFRVVGHLRPSDVRSLLEPDSDRSATGISRTTPLLVRMGSFEPEDLRELVIHAQDTGRPVFVEASEVGLRRSRVTIRRLDTKRTVEKVAPARLSGVRGTEKRVIDVVLSALLIVAGLPFLLLIGGAVLAFSGRPVFYSQDRVGRKDKRFRIWKFRTMQPDAEPAGSPVWSKSEDERRTKIGSVLRRFSLDELPQLWNVLRGDMSLIGPRPERPVFAEQFRGEHSSYRYRHRIRPGMTGLAQASGFRGDTGIESRVELDNWYIENWSLSLDLKIAIQTLGEVIRGRGA